MWVPDPPPRDLACDPLLYLPNRLRPRPRRGGYVTRFLVRDRPNTRTPERPNVLALEQSPPTARPGGPMSIRWASPAMKRRGVVRPAASRAARRRTKPFDHWTVRLSDRACEGLRGRFAPCRGATDGAPPANFGVWRQGRRKILASGENGHVTFNLPGPPEGACAFRACLLALGAERLARLHKSFPSPPEGGRGLPACGGMEVRRAGTLAAVSCRTAEPATRPAGNHRNRGTDLRDGRTLFGGGRTVARSVGTQLREQSNGRTVVRS